MPLIEQCAWHHQRQTDQQIGKLSDKRGIRPLKQYVQYDLQRFDRRTGQRSQSETAQHDGHFVKAQLIKRRGKRQWDLKEHQNKSDGCQDRHLGDPLHAGCF